MGEWWADFLGMLWKTRRGKRESVNFALGGAIKSGRRPLLVTSLVGTRFCSMKTLSVPSATVRSAHGKPLWTP